METYTKSAMGIEFKVVEDKDGDLDYQTTDGIHLWNTKFVSVEELRAILYLEGLRQQKLEKETK